MTDLHNTCNEIKEGLARMANNRMATYTALLAALEMETLLTKMEMDMDQEKEHF